MFKGRQTACRGKVRKKKTLIVCFVYLPFSRVCEKRVFSLLSKLLESEFGN